MGIVYGAQEGTRASEASDRAAEVSSLESDIEQAQQDLEQAQRTAVDDAAGADLDRMNRDNSAISRLLGHVLTWDSHAEYVEGRQVMIDEYGLTGDSSFMQTFMPQAPVNVDSEGNEYPYIDAAGLNSSVGEVDTSLLWVSAGEHRYLVTAEQSSTASVGDFTGTGSRTAVLLVIVDGNGDISEVEGYVSSGDERSTTGGSR